MNHYATNRRWSDQFLPQIKRIVGCHLLETAPDPLDWHQITDLLMLDARDMRIAARVRRPGFANKYPCQFTIRSLVAQADGLVCGNKCNADGTRFTWFDIRSFPDEPKLVVERSDIE